MPLAGKAPVENHIVALAQGYGGGVIIGGQRGGPGEDQDTFLMIV